MTATLYKVPVSAWVSGTAQKMNAAGVEDRESWSRYWVETYDALGGASSSGSKPCPRSAGYGLWYVGWLKGSKRPALSWSINEIRDSLGKNAAYAAIAIRLLRQGAQPYPVGQVWKSVRREFERATDDSAANTEQGAVKLAIALFLEGKLVTAENEYEDLAESPKAGQEPNLTVMGEKMTEESLRIAPRYTAGDWKSLDFSTEEGWKNAIAIFEDRMRGRFLEPVVGIEGYTYAGFAVLALDCLLIETLQQFRRGVPRTPHRQSKAFFVSFLTGISFGKHFTEKMAEMFYEQIRCGILHQAETEGSSKILIRETVPLVKHTDDRNGLVINRKLFHEQLVREFEAYVAELRDPSNQELRRNFRTKMDYVCRVSGEWQEAKHV